MITEAEAKAFAQKYIPACQAFDAFLPSHFASVVRVAKHMAKIDGLNVDEAAAAAWLHDIGYSKGEKEGHAEESLRICQAANLSLSPGQADAIANHGNSSEPRTPLGLLMKLADKLSLLDFDLVVDMYPKDLKKLDSRILPMIGGAIDYYLSKK